MPETKEVDSDRPLVPMTPGHPGLSVVTKVSNRDLILKKSYFLLIRILPITELLHL